MVKKIVNFLSTKTGQASAAVLFLVLAQIATAAAQQLTPPTATPESNPLAGLFYAPLGALASAATWVGEMCNAVAIVAIGALLLSVVYEIAVPSSKK